MRRTTYIWLGFRITLTPLTRRIYKEGSGRLLRRNVSYIAQYFTPFGGGSEQVNKTRNQVKDDRRSRYPLERGTYLIRGMGPHVSKVSLKYLFTEISKDSSEISILGIIHYIIR